MNNFNKLKKIVKVFHLYGIRLTGKRKFDSLYKVYKMDQVFVLGLIFELELITKNQIKDEDAYSIQSPAQIIQKLIPNE
ncbi:MAG: acyl carrier protein [Cyclobacteriaceae bacterium]|nr:acyl carrier protein [Cyclobacteriaceae bacterium]